MSAAPAPGARRRPRWTTTPHGRRRDGWTPYALLTPGMLWLAVFFLIPTVMLLYMSLSSGTAFSGNGTFSFDWHFSNYGDAWKQYVFEKPIFQKSLIYALIATVLCLIVAYPLAYTIAFKSGRWKNFLLVLVIAPFFTSFLLRTNAWERSFPTMASSSPSCTTPECSRSPPSINVPDSWPSWTQMFPDGMTADNRVLQTPLAVILASPTTSCRS